MWAKDASRQNLTTPSACISGRGLSALLVDPIGQWHLLGVTPPSRCHLELETDLILKLRMGVSLERQLIEADPPLQTSKSQP